MMRLSEQPANPNAGGKNYQSRLENIKYTPVGGAPLDAPAYPNAAKQPPTPAAAGGAPGAATSQP